MAIPWMETPLGKKDQERRERQAQAIVERRFAILKMDIEFLIAYMRNGITELQIPKRKLTFDGIPWDALVTAVHVDPYQPNQIMLRMASMEFSKVHEGGIPPDIYVQMTEHWQEIEP